MEKATTAEVFGLIVAGLKLLFGTGATAVYCFIRGQRERARTLDAQVAALKELTTTVDGLDRQLKQEATAAQQAHYELRDKLHHIDLKMTDESFKLRTEVSKLVAVQQLMSVQLLAWQQVTTQHMAHR